VKVPLKPPPLTVLTVAAIVQGPVIDVLYWRTTGAPLGTAVLADTDPEKATLVWPPDRGVVIGLRVVVVV
jgi:hypothetical protein